MKEITPLVWKHKGGDRMQHPRGSWLARGTASSWSQLSLLEDISAEGSQNPSCPREERYDAFGFGSAVCFFNKMRTEVNFGPGMNKKEHFVLLFILRQTGNSPGCADVFVGEKHRCGNPGEKGVTWGRYKVVQDSLAPFLVTGPETEDPNYNIITLFIKIFNRIDTWGCGSEGNI